MEIYRGIPTFPEDKSGEIIEGIEKMPIRGLFSIWEKLHIQSTEKEQNQFGQALHDYIYANLAVQTEVINDPFIGKSVRKRISKSLSKILQYNSPTNRTDIFSLWYALANKSNLINRDKIKQKWYTEVQKSTDTFKHAENQITYFSATDELIKTPDVTKKELITTATELRNALPSLRSFPKEFCPLPKNSHEDNEKPKQRNIFKYNIGAAAYFIRRVKSWNIVSEDINWLDKYFRNALREIDIKNTDNYVIAKLLQHLRLDKSVSEEELWSITQLTYSRSNDPHHESLFTRDEVLDEIIRCFLKCNDINSAIAAYKQIEDEFQLNFSTIDLIKFGLKKNKIEQVRALYPYFLFKNISELIYKIPDEEIIEKIKNKWSLAWISAASLLAMDGINVFSEPEVKQYIWQGEYDFKLNDLVEWASQFPQDSILRQLVIFRLSKKIREYNLQQKIPQILYHRSPETGESYLQSLSLSLHDVENLTEALLRYKLLVKNHPQTSSNKLNYSDISNQPFN